MPRTRHIRQVLDPHIARQEATNITKLFSVLGWAVRKAVAKENGKTVHRIVVRKGETVSVLVELEEAVNDKKGKEKSTLEESTPRQHPESPFHPKRRLMERMKKEKPLPFEGLQKEDLKAYIEQDETGIVPALVTEGALVLEDGAVQFTRIIEREKFLFAREYFQRIGLKWTTNFRMELQYELQNDNT